MNNELKQSIEKEKEIFDKIRKKGFLKNVKSDKNNGGAGNTYEYHAGVKENPQQEADHEGWEYKTKKAVTALTFFSKKYTFPKGGDEYVRINFGLPSKPKYPDILCLETRVFTNKWAATYTKLAKKNLIPEGYCQYQIKNVVDEKEKKIFTLFSEINNKPRKEVFYWTFDDIKRGFRKLENMVLFDGINIKKIDGKDHYHYLKAKILCQSKGFDNFINLIKKDKIIFEHRHGHTGSKKHNRGNAFRLHKVSDINLLFDYCEEIE